MGPSPGDRLERFKFSGEDCLYRDHLDRRVVADWEGDGVIASLGSSANLLLNEDAIQSGMFPEFRDFGTLVALESGEVDCTFRKGSIPSNSLSSKSTKVAGIGFVAADQPGAIVDGKHLGHDQACELPRPFWTGFECSVPLAYHVEPGRISEKLVGIVVDDSWDYLPANGKIQNSSAVRRLESTDCRGASLNLDVLSHLNAIEFDLLLPFDIVGIMVRKAYDCFHGRQRARVMIDGHEIGIWSVPRSNRIQRWATDSQSFPVSAAAGSVRFTLDPLPGAPLWSMQALDVFAIPRFGINQRGRTR